MPAQPKQPNLPFSDNASSKFPQFYPWIPTVVLLSNQTEEFNEASKNFSANRFAFQEFRILSAFLAFDTRRTSNPRRASGGVAQ